MTADYSNQLYVIVIIAIVIGHNNIVPVERKRSQQQPHRTIIQIQIFINVDQAQNLVYWAI